MPFLEQDDQYYIIKRDNLTARQVFFFILNSPVFAIRWVFSFIIGLLVTVLALNPFNVRHQRQIHCLTDDFPDVIVNLMPRESYKFVRDLFSKAHFLISLVSFVPYNKRALGIESQPHIDEMIEHIIALNNGTSAAKHCGGRRFEWNNIHVKGLEGLDPGLRDYFWAKLEEKLGITKETPHQSLFDFYTLQTIDGGILDSVEVLGPNEKEKAIDERRFIISCLARDKNYITQLSEYSITANSIDCTVIGFNYRGVCYSKGLVWTQDNMVDDAVDQAERLILSGANPEYICLDGHCIGGVVATLAAEILRQRGYNVKVINDRSFQSLPNFLAGYLFPEPNESLFNPIVLIRYVLGSLVYVSMWVILWLSHWEMDAASAWKNIPDKDKTYVVAHEMQGDELLPSDGIVHSWVTIAALEKNPDKESVFIPKRYHKDLELDDDEEDANRMAHHISWRKNLIQAAPIGPRKSAQSFLHDRQRVMLGLPIKHQEAPNEVDPEQGLHKYS